MASSLSKAWRINPSSGLPSAGAPAYEVDEQGRPILKSRAGGFVDTSNVVHMSVRKGRWRRWHYKAENGKRESLGGVATSRKKAITACERAADNL